MLYLPAEFPQDPKVCYLNHAAMGPWPRRTAETVIRFAQQNMTWADTSYSQWLHTERRLRERIARMINAHSADDIALTKNTSEGLSIISQGLDWRQDDIIVGVADDFCSNRMVWEVLADRGVRYQAIDVFARDDPEQALIDALDRGVRLLAISTVHFANGYRFDLPRLAAACRENDALLSVDVIQSLGAVPFDLAAVDADFVTCGGHKWLLAPEGLGFFYCRPSLRDRLSLHQFGWAMRESPYEFESIGWEVARSARRFESGTPNMMGIQALDASLSLFEEIGMEVVHERLEHNLAFLYDALTQLDRIHPITPESPGKRAGILTFTVDGCEPQDLHRGLTDAGIICSPRGGGIRLAPHFYTPQTVLERASNLIRQSI